MNLLPATVGYLRWLNRWAYFPFTPMRVLFPVHTIRLPSDCSVKTSVCRLLAGLSAEGIGFHKLAGGWPASQDPSTRYDTSRKDRRTVEDGARQRVQKSDVNVWEMSGSKGSWLLGAEVEERGVVPQGKKHALQRIVKQHTCLFSVVMISMLSGGGWLYRSHQCVLKA